MTIGVTIQQLADIKKIPVAVLQSFGLSETSQGVLFCYRMPNGQLGRPRLRLALSGADGSQWSGTEALPITAYVPPPIVRIEDPTELIVVEGESDCWTAWMHGIRAVGIPGSERVGVLESDHFRGAASLFILRERVEGRNKTFPWGVDRFVDDVVDRARRIGFAGPIRVLIMPQPSSDISDLYLTAASDFVPQLRRAMREASVRGQSEHE